MSYIIGSFNLKKLANSERKNIDVIADIIRNENMDIVALQEVFREEAVENLCTFLGTNRWDYSWEKPKNNDSSNANEGYAYVWKKDRLGKVISYSERSGKRIFNPRINIQYRKFGGDELLRPPYYGRFTPNECPGGNQMELRLLNVHLRFSGNQEDYSNIEARRHEFRILTEGLLPKIQDKVYQTQYNTYTLILGDYNLNIPNHINESPYLNNFVVLEHNNEQRIVTVQDEKTTLKVDQAKPYENNAHRYANNYDHFTYDESMLGKCDILQCRRVDGAKYIGSNYADYLKVVSDHMPILIELDIRGGSR